MTNDGLSCAGGEKDTVRCSQQATSSDKGSRKSGVIVANKTKADQHVPKIEEWRNKVVQGDCLELIKQLSDNSIDLVITSPPYYNPSHKYQRGKGYHYSFNYQEPLYLVIEAMKLLYSKLKEDGIICLNLCFSYGETGVLRPFEIVRKLCFELGYFLNDLIIWHKNNPVPLKNRLTNAYELIFVLSKNPIIKYNTRKYEHNVWKFPVERGFEGFSASFPLELPIRCIKTFSNTSSLILDCFAGSGTTAVACKQLGRDFIGFEVNPSYVNMCNKRLSQEVLL